MARARVESEGKGGAAIERHGPIGTKKNGSTLQPAKTVEQVLRYDRSPMSWDIPLRECTDCRTISIQVG